MRIYTYLSISVYLIYQLLAGSYIGSAIRCIQLVISSSENHIPCGQDSTLRTVALKQITTNSSTRSPRADRLILIRGRFPLQMPPRVPCKRVNRRSPAHHAAALPIPCGPPARHISPCRLADRLQCIGGPRRQANFRISSLQQQQPRHRGSLSAEADCALVHPSILYTATDAGQVQSPKNQR